MMSTPLMTSAQVRGIWNRLVTMAEEESTCAMMLMKMPMRKRVEPMVSALRPYSLATISKRVVQPLRRMGPA